MITARVREQFHRCTQYPTAVQTRRCGVCVKDEFGACASRSRNATRMVGRVSSLPMWKAHLHDRSLTRAPMKSLSRRRIRTRRRVDPLDRAERSHHCFLLIVRLLVKVFDERVHFQERRWD